jgi:hypothetical protein
MMILSDGHNDSLSNSFSLPFCVIADVNELSGEIPTKLGQLSTLRFLQLCKYYEHTNFR